MRADLLTDDKRKKEERKERRGGKKGTSRMFYFHLHDNESFREKERERENLFVWKEQSFGFEGFATGRNNKDYRR